MFVAHSSRTHLLCLIIIVAAMVAIGHLFIYSASFLFALETTGSSYFFLCKQFTGFIIGIIIALIIQFIPIECIRIGSPVLFISSTLLTLGTLLPQYGHCIHGAKRWMRINGILFQPSELLKIGCVLLCAYILARQDHSFALSSLRRLLPFVIILICTSVILLLQPDFGLTITLIITVGAMIFAVRGNIRAVFIALLGFLPIAALLILYKPYRLQRVLTFLNPWNDPQGAGFQIIQSLIAIGSGKWFGVGISHSKQKYFYLPMQHTDFIFSIIAEEAGLAGACFVIMLYIALVYVGIHIACTIRNKFASYATFGLVFLISIQALINIAVATGLAPTKGTGLPLISYGKSALIANLIIISLIVRFARTNPTQKYYDIALS
jgi:cell division protein FtsW